MHVLGAWKFHSQTTYARKVPQGVNDSRHINLMSTKTSVSFLMTSERVIKTATRSILQSLALYLFEGVASSLLLQALPKGPNTDSISGRTEGLLMSRAVAIFDKQSHTTDNGWPSNLWILCRTTTNSPLHIVTYYEKLHKASHSGI